MMEEIVILQGAESDILAAFIKYENRGKGDAFCSAIDDKLKLILSYPHLGKVAVNDFRRIILTKFPYAIYYKTHGNRLFVAAILSLKMDPAKIIERLKYTLDAGEGDG